MTYNLTKSALPENPNSFEPFIFETLPDLDKIQKGFKVWEEKEVLNNV